MYVPGVFVSARWQAWLLSAASYLRLAPLEASLASAFPECWGLLRVARDVDAALQCGKPSGFFKIPHDGYDLDVVAMGITLASRAGIMLPSSLSASAAIPLACMSKNAADQTELCILTILPLMCRAQYLQDRRIFMVLPVQVQLLCSWSQFWWPMVQESQPLSILV